IPLAGPPDGGLITPKLGSKVFLPPTGGDAQDNSSTANLIPRRRVPVNDPLQLDDIPSGDRQRFRLASSHVLTSHTDPEYNVSVPGNRNSLQVFVPETLAVVTGGVLSILTFRVWVVSWLPALSTL